MGEEKISSAYVIKQSIQVRGLCLHISMWSHPSQSSLYLSVCHLMAIGAFVCHACVSVADQTNPRPYLMLTFGANKDFVFTIATAGKCWSILAEILADQFKVFAESAAVDPGLWFNQC
mgnify:CR=1 FL=1